MLVGSQSWRRKRRDQLRIIIFRLCHALRTTALRPLFPSNYVALLYNYIIHDAVCRCDLVENFLLVWYERFGKFKVIRTRASKEYFLRISASVLQPLLPNCLLNPLGFRVTIEPTTYYISHTIQYSSFTFIHLWVDQWLFNFSLLPSLSVTSTLNARLYI